MLGLPRHELTRLSTAPQLEACVCACRRRGLAKPERTNPVRRPIKALKRVRARQMLGGGGAAQSQGPQGRPSRAQREGEAGDLEALSLLPAEEAQRWRRTILCAHPSPPPLLPAPSSMSVAADSLYQSMECMERCSWFKAGLNWWVGSL